MIPNIGSIKILKRLSPKIFFTFLAIFFGGIIHFILWGVSGAVSYEVGFVCFILVFLSLFFSMNSRLKNTQEEFNFSQKLTLGLVVSFSLFRILSYIVLIVAIIALIEFSLFSLYAYMIGVFISLLISLLSLSVGMTR